MLWVVFGGGGSQGLLEWKGRQSHYWVDVWHMTWQFDFNLAMDFQFQPFVKTEVFTSPYKKICQTQNHDFFPWTKKENWVHKQNTTSKSERPRTAHKLSSLAGAELDWIKKPGGRSHVCTGFAHKTPKFSRYSWKKTVIFKFTRILNSLWLFSITYTQNSPCDKGLPYWAD